MLFHGLSNSEEAKTRLDCYQLKCAIALQRFSRHSLHAIDRDPRITKPDNNRAKGMLVEMEEKRDAPSMVVVMGVTGAGKSYFINQLAGKEVVQESSNLDSCKRILLYDCAPSKSAKAHKSVSLYRHLLVIAKCS
jgi:hypothetical protein